EGRQRQKSLHIRVDAGSEAVPDPFRMRLRSLIPPGPKALRPQKSEDKVALAKRRISIFEKGKAVRPGEDSPEHRPSGPLSTEQRRRTIIRKPSSMFGSARNYLS
ncbi:unnamed protein product, partial [Ixodes hexagonus]